MINFQKMSDDFQRHWSGLLDIRDKLHSLPTTRKLADRLTKLCHELEEIDEGLSTVDHFGNT